jgi:ABC-type antimicrobial peptide transport system permease subunit
LTQVVLGVVAGTALIAVAAIAMQQTEQFGDMAGRGLSPGEIAALVGYAILMVGVCMLACVVPTLRALRVQPTEALRAD